MRCAGANYTKIRIDVFKTCVHCCDHLGANEVLSTFPVGERLAFDSVKGRLWVICPRCSRWNLTPLEERWEAIEECDRLFRITPARLATDRIGLAVVAIGTAQGPPRLFSRGARACPGSQPARQPGMAMGAFSGTLTALTAAECVALMG